MHFSTQILSQRIFRNIWELPRMKKHFRLLGREGKKNSRKNSSFLCERNRRKMFLFAHFCRIWWDIRVHVHVFSTDDYIFSIIFIWIFGWLFAKSTKKKFHGWCHFEQHVGGWLKAAQHLCTRLGEKTFWKMFILALYLPTSFTISVSISSKINHEKLWKWNTI